jgi:DNA-directed RNA polymerase subunit RPC12/RpoP
MIDFPCKSCGQKLKVEEKHSGKRIKCPKCGSAGVVPDNSDKIKFHCDSCGQSISVPQIHAGKKGKCPKCGTPIVVPSPEGETATSAASGPSIPSDTDEESYADEDSYQDESDLPEEHEGVDRRLIFAICGAVAIVVVGIIILFTVILPSGSGPAEEPYQQPGQEAADVDSPSSPVASEAEPAGTFTPQPPKEDGSPEEPGQSPVAAGDETGKLDLKLRLKPGRKFNMQIVRDSKNSQTTSRGPAYYNDINTMGLEFEVEQVDTSGVAWLKVTYLTIREVRKDEQEQSVAKLGFASEYDSTKPDTNLNYRNGPLYRAMIGQSFVAKITPQGEIVELKGLDETFDRMAKLVVEYEDEGIRQRMAEFSSKRVEERAKTSIDRRNQQYGSIEKRIEAKRERLADSGHSAKGLIREMLGNVIMPFPGGPVGIGDSWQAGTALFSIGAGDVGLDDCTYTLKEAKQGAVLVDFGSKIEVDDEHLYGEEGSPGSARVTLAGSCQGSLEIDPSTGWMLRKTVTMHCSGEAKTAPSQRRPQGSTRGLSMESVTTVKPIEEPSVSPLQDAADVDSRSNPVASEGNLSQSNEEVTSLDHVLALWDQGDKDAATAAFLSIRWNDPAALANVPVMNLSEKQFRALSKGERNRTTKEYADLRARLLVGVARHVRSVGDAAVAKGDKQTARAHYEGILRCGQALSSPDRLEIMKLGGEAAIRMAQKGLSSLE